MRHAPSHHSGMRTCSGRTAMSNDRSPSETECLEHACRFVWMLAVPSEQERQHGSLAQGPPSTPALSVTPDRLEELIVELKELTLGKKEEPFWTEEVFRLDNENALLPHIEARFPTSEERQEAEAARKLRLTRSGRSLICSSRLMLWKGYKKPKRGKSREDFVRIRDAEIIFLPDGTAACVLELTIGNLSEAEGDTLPVVGSKIPGLHEQNRNQNKDREHLKQASDTQIEDRGDVSPQVTTPVKSVKERSKRKDPSPSIESLEEVFCRVRRALVDGKIYASPQYAQNQVTRVHSGHSPGNGEALERLLGKVTGCTEEGGTPICDPFRLRELRDGLFGVLRGPDQEGQEWARPMLYTMVRVPDSFGAVEELAFRLANGFDHDYPMPESKQGLMVRTPLRNRWFGASRSGAVAVCIDDGHEFHSQFMQRLKADYFLIYLIALHQRHYLHELNDQTARLLTRQDLRADTLEKDKEHKLKELRSRMQEFLTHTRARHVSDYVLHAEAYGCFWEALGLDDLYSSANESILELNSLFDRKRDERATELERRQKRIVQFLLYLGMPLTFASTLFGLNLGEFKESLQLLDDPVVLGCLGGCVVLGLTIALVVRIYSNRKPA